MITIAIWLLQKVLLVVFLSRIEGLSRAHLSHHLLISIRLYLPLIQQPLHLLYDPLSHFLLLLGVAEYHGGVLGAAVILLVVQGRRIVESEEVAG